MPYTDSSLIAGYLGITLTGAQETQAGILADAATAWVDKYTGRTWRTASPVSDEMHAIVGNAVYLDQRPVATVTSVKTRQPYSDASVTTLTAAQWELVDAANGRLLITGWASSDLWALVSYTHTVSDPPDDVLLATTMVAASWLQQSLRPNTAGVESVSVGQNDISVKFGASRGDVPTEALSILRAYRAVVVA